MNDRTAPANPDGKRAKNALRPVFITSLLLAASMTLTFLLFRGVRQPSLFSTNILVLTLVNVNITLVILLILFLSRNIIKLYFERRRYQSRFKTKLVAAFLGLSMIPSILLFVVASGLLTSSIENWFSIQVERSLDHSLEIAQNYYQILQENVSTNAQEIGRLLAGQNLLSGAQIDLVRFLKEKQQNSSAAAIHLFTRTDSGQFQPLVSLSKISSEGQPDPFLPSDDFLKQALQKPMTAIQTTYEGDVIRAAIPVQNGDRAVAVLVVDRLIPSSMVQKMEEIKKESEEYKQLKAFKNPIKGSYILSFFIILLLILFSAVWFGFYLARSITIPLQRLAEATERVAGGNVDFQVDVTAADELGVLVDSFNKMTSDLSQSQRKVEEANQSLTQTNQTLERERAYMEGLLQNIGAGVISVDAKGMITTFNPSAEKILELSSKVAIGAEAIELFTLQKMGAMAGLLRKMGTTDTMEEEIHLEVHGKFLTLRVALSALQGDDGHPLGDVIVFDDVTELIRAQKLATWQEVARRIAHEIKNPLTPIQLSTERLRKKYFDRSDDFDKIFDESTQTVINEVHDLKTLVDEFSNFARMPPAHPSLQKIDPILQEVVSLYQASQKDMVVSSHFDGTLPPLNLDRDQIKRAFVNLFENAVEAMDGRGTLQIATSYDIELKRVRVEVSDEGDGIATEDMDKLFLPYFSRKKGGTGLGLAIVNRIVLDHNASIHVIPREPKGTTFIIAFPA